VSSVESFRRLSPFALNLIQEDRAVFCKRGRNQTRLIDWPAGDVAANLFGRLRDFDHKPDRR